MAKWIPFLLHNIHVIKKIFLLSIFRTSLGILKIVGEGFMAFYITANRVKSGSYNHYYLHAFFVVNVTYKAPKMKWRNMIYIYIYIFLICLQWQTIIAISCRKPITWKNNGLVGHLWSNNKYCSMTKDIFNNNLLILDTYKINSVSNLVKNKYYITCKIDFIVIKNDSFFPQSS